MMPDGDSPKPSPVPAEDVVLAYAPTDDGEGARVLRKRAETIETGEVRPLKEGRPITGEVVRLKPREGSPALHDVEVLAKVDAPAAAHKGPAQVATAKYRESWERVFGERTLN